MFEAAERALRQEIQTALGMEVFIAFPDPEILRKTHPPVGVLYLNACQMLDLISDGVPEGTTLFVGEARMSFELHLLCDDRRQLEALTLKIFRHFHHTTHIGPGGEYVVESLSFREVYPSAEEERLFTRVFTLPLLGPITLDLSVPLVQEVETRGTLQP